MANGTMRVVVGIAHASAYLHWSPAVNIFSQSILFPPFLLPCPPCPQGDVFSFGMTLSELLTFHPPFCGGRGGYRAPNELYEKIRNGERPRLSLKVGTGHGSQVVGSVLVWHASVLTQLGTGVVMQYTGFTCCQWYGKSSVLRSLPSPPPDVHEQPHSAAAAHGHVLGCHATAPPFHGSGTRGGQQGGVPTAAL